MVKNREGFTIAEILVAMTILLVGILAFIGTSAATSRMLSRGNRSTKAAFYSQERLETLSSTPCQLLANGSTTRGGGAYTLTWEISDALGGNSKRAKVITSYFAVRGTTRADTSEISILCIR